MLKTCWKPIILRQDNQHILKILTKSFITNIPKIQCLNVLSFYPYTVWILSSFCISVLIKALSYFTLNNHSCRGEKFSLGNQPIYKLTLIKLISNMLYFYPYILPRFLLLLLNTYLKHTYQKPKKIPKHSFQITNVLSIEGVKFLSQNYWNTLIN